MSVNNINQIELEFNYIAVTHEDGNSTVERGRQNVPPEIGKIVVENWQKSQKLLKNREKGQFSIHEIFFEHFKFFFVFGPNAQDFARRILNFPYWCKLFIKR